jgi:hypothetical protein
MKISMLLRKNRKISVLYNPGDENAFGEHNQPNEMGTDIFKDKHQGELVDLFNDVLKPGGWRMDQRPPPNTCANYTFVPASVASIDRTNLYKHGTPGKHYAVEWAGLKTMIAIYGGTDYAPVLSLGTSVQGEDDTTVAFDPPVVEEAEEEAYPLIGATISTYVAALPAEPSCLVEDETLNPVMVQDAASQNVARVSVPIIQPSSDSVPIAPSTRMPGRTIAVVNSRRVIATKCRPQLSLQLLYAHKRLLEDDLEHLEGCLEDHVGPAHKRARIEAELADQETNYSLVKKAILEGYVPIAVTYDI